MHALIQASLVLLFISPRATAKPIAIGSDFSSDYSLFTGDDSELLGAGDDLGLVDPSDDVSALIAVDSACSSDVSLSNDDDLFVRDLDDTLLLGKKPATCVNPDQSSGSDRQKLELPQFEMLAPIDGTTSDGRCNTYGQSVLACCDYSKSTSPTNCVAWPFSDCNDRWEYCCREILPNMMGNNCEMLEGSLEKMIRGMGYPANWEEMPITGPLDPPSTWVNPWTNNGPNR